MYSHFLEIYPYPRKGVFTDWKDRTKYNWQEHIKRKQAEQQPKETEQPEIEKPEKLKKKFCVTSYHWARWLIGRKWPIGARLVWRDRAFSTFFCEIIEKTKHRREWRRENDWNYYCTGGDLGCRGPLFESFEDRKLTILPEVEVRIFTEIFSFCKKWPRQPGLSPFGFWPLFSLKTAVFFLLTFLEIRLWMWNWNKCQTLWLVRTWSIPRASLPVCKVCFPAMAVIFKTLKKLDFRNQVRPFLEHRHFLTNLAS